MTDSAPEAGHAWHVRVVESDEAFDVRDYSRARLRTLFLVAVLLLLATAAAASWSYRRLAAPPNVVVLAGPEVWRSPAVTMLQEAQLRPHFRAVLEGVLTRSEKGAPPELRAFLVEDAAAKIDALYASAVNTPGGFLQTFAIAEDGMRVLHDTALVAGYAVRGLLSSRTLHGTQTSEVFLLAGFQRRAPTPDNPLGWRLNGLATATREDFFGREREAEAAQRLTPAPRP